MESKQASQVTWGLIVVTVGLILLAGQTDTGWQVNFGRLWPVVFFLIGVGKFLRQDVRTGVWFFCLGGIFLLHTYRVMTLNDSWPLFIVMAGLSMLFRDRKAEDWKVEKKVTFGVGPRPDSPTEGPRHDG
jgi:hypothetical protein